MIKMATSLMYDHQLPKSRVMVRLSHSKRLTGAKVVLSIAAI